MKGITLISALQCLANAQNEIANEFDLDPETNFYGKPLPEWAAAVRDLIHAAQNHLVNYSKALDVNEDSMD